MLDFEPILRLVTTFGTSIIFIGMVKFFLSFRNEDCELLSSAKMTIIAGASMIAMSTVVRSLMMNSEGDLGSINHDEAQVAENPLIDFSEFDIVFFGKILVLVVGVFVVAFFVFLVVNILKKRHDEKEEILENKRRILMTPLEVLVEENLREIEKRDISETTGVLLHSDVAFNRLVEKYEKMDCFNEQEFKTKKQRKRRD